MEGVRCGGCEVWRVWGVEGVRWRVVRGILVPTGVRRAAGAYLQTAYCQISHAMPQNLNLYLLIFGSLHSWLALK